MKNPVNDMIITDVDYINVDMHILGTVLYVNIPYTQEGEKKEAMFYGIGSSQDELMRRMQKIQDEIDTVMEIQEEFGKFQDEEATEEATRFVDIVWHIVKEEEINRECLAYFNAIGRL